jgi:bacillithiol synthase
VLKNTLPLNEAGQFPNLFIDFIQKKQDLKGFFSNFPDLEGFENQLSTKKFSNRAVLVNELKAQYNGLGMVSNIDLLAEENTFTVTTGHQLNICTGPLYVIYKIVSTINLAEKLKQSFPKYNFVPVYWMATEDHDFEEISYFNLFGNKIQWQTSQTGAVGRMNPNEISAILESIPEAGLFSEIYKSATSLSEAVRNYMHHLFGKYGLVCIDGDSAALKGLFKNVMHDDLFKHSAENYVSGTSDKLEKLHYKTQVSARNINLFFLDDKLRARIERNEHGFTVLGTDLVFSDSEIERMLNESPEKLSPNVVLRPLYQETILPNLAYLGGPSEVAYWLQLGDVFRHFEVPFPILMPRNFALVLTAANQKKIDKLGLTIADLFKNDHELKRDFVAKNSENELSLSSEINKIVEALAEISNKAKAIDPTLVGAVEAEKAKVLGGISNLEKRLKKQEEKKFETVLGQIDTVKVKLFPNGGLQERSENFLNFYANDPEFISKVKTAFDPLNFDFNIISV